MTETDLEQILETERQSFPNPWTRQNFLHELRDNPHAVNRVVRCGDRVAAYVCGWQVAGELKVNNVAVHPDCRRRGIARRLLLSVFDSARLAGCRVVTLEVRLSNAEARQLYRELGFREDGRRENYYPTCGEAAILMSLAL